MAEESSAILTSRAGRWTLADKSSGTKPEDSSNDACDTSAPEPIVRHPNFCFDNVLVAIRIENTLFNVHKYQLVKSRAFSDMFKLPRPKGHELEEGSSPEHPIAIDGIAASDFAALLTVLYASHFSSNQPTPQASLVIPAFRLANMFDFSDLRAYLLPLAEEKLDDVDKVVFAREFGIKEWLAPAHIRLCKREEVLSTGEARKLGVDSVLLIWRMREKHRNRGLAITPGQSYCKSCTGLGGNFSGTCGHCNVYHNSGLTHCNENGTMGTSTSIDDSALEAEVRKWVGD